MAVEKILGDDTDNAGSFFFISDQNYGADYTATWAGVASSVTCTTGKIRFDDWDQDTVNIKMIVWNASTGAVIQVSDVLQINFTGGGAAWHTFTFAGVTIDKNTSYTLGLITDNQYEWVCGSGTGSIPEFGSNDYGTPTNFSGGGGNKGLDSFSCYLEADTAGGGGGLPMATYQQHRRRG